MTTDSVYYRNTRREIRSLLPRQYARVLEIGCGEGNFRESAELSCEYWGIEPFEAAAAIAAKKMDRVLVGTYQEVSTKLPTQYFDLVICNDVIEHMIDHDAFFKSIKQHLATDGFLVASVPNVRYIANLYGILVKRDWRYKDTGVLDRTHLRFFTERSLKRSLSQNGFAIDEFKGINSFSEKSQNGLLTRYAGYLASLILGPDIKFLQFGIRVRAVSRDLS